MKRENLIRNFLIAALAVGLLFQNTISVRAAFGDLDPSFSGDGIFTDPYSYQPYAIARQADGKILVIATAGLLTLRRYNANGTVDTSFGSNGTAIPYNTTGWTRDLMVQSDGKIVVVGKACSYDCTAIWRFNSDGWYDPSFGSNGRISFYGGDAQSVAGYKPTKTSPQNLFVIVDGQKLYRFGPTGALVTSFGNGGSIDLPLAGLDLAVRQSSIYVTGFLISTDVAAIAKYSADGVIDSSFGALGVFSQSAFQDCGGSLPAGQVLGRETYNNIGFQSDGKIVTGGYFEANDGQYSYRYALVNRHLTDGSFDTGFPPTCGYLSPTPKGLITSMSVLTDNRIVFNDYNASRIFRLTAAGAADGDFPAATSGGILDFVTQPDGKIVVVGRVNVVGNNHARLSRYLP